MICSRCGKTVNTERQERNAEFFGSNVFACPYCGKAHFVRSVVKIDFRPFNSSCDEDDWGNVIISDEEYEKIQRLKK